ncbi:hypothetical protein BWD08_05245 [Neisseria animaloris]|nr:hypothetical protein BWD08_05245 [Neisseria animaloris]
MIQAECRPLCRLVRGYIGILAKSVVVKCSFKRLKLHYFVFYQNSNFEIQENKKICNKNPV